MYFISARKKSLFLSNETWPEFYFIYFYCRFLLVTFPGNKRNIKNKLRKLYLAIEREIVRLNK